MRVPLSPLLSPLSVSLGITYDTLEVDLLSLETCELLVSCVLIFRAPHIAQSIRTPDVSTHFTRVSYMVHIATPPHLTSHMRMHDAAVVARAAPGSVGAFLRHDAGHCAGRRERRGEYSEVLRGLGRTAAAAPE